MDIKSITVGYHMTYNLGNYSKVHPSVSFTVDVQPGEDTQAIVTRLKNDCREIVESEIDKTLEQRGDRPKFYTGQRYTMLHWRSTGLNVLVRADIADDHDRKHVLPGTWNVRNQFENEHVWNRQRAELLLDWARELCINTVRADHLDSLEILGEWAKLYISEHQLQCVVGTNLDVSSRYGRTIYELLLVVPFDLFRELLLKSKEEFYIKSEFPIATVADINTWFAGNRPGHQKQICYFDTLDAVNVYLAEMQSELDQQFGYHPAPVPKPDRDAGGFPDGTELDEPDDADEE